LPVFDEAGLVPWAKVKSQYVKIFGFQEVKLDSRKDERWLFYNTSRSNGKFRTDRLSIQVCNAQSAPKIKETVCPDRLQQSFGPQRYFASRKGSRDSFVLFF
jgi:hypothetical protein